MLGMLSHMIWSCLHIQSYWNSVYRLFSMVTRVLVKANLEQHNSTINVDNYPPQPRPIVVKIVTVACLMLLKKWKSSTIPNISEVKCHIDVIFQYEQIMAYKYGTQHQHGT